MSFVSLRFLTATEYLSLNQYPLSQSGPHLFSIMKRHNHNMIPLLDASSWAGSQKLDVWMKVGLSRVVDPVWARRFHRDFPVFAGLN
eukprot:scaffold5017_cov171-Amphora_coffeaeformis.AAC.20